MNDEVGVTPSVVVVRLNAMVPESAASDGADRTFEQSTAYLMLQLSFCIV